jgi:regulatory protein
MARDFSRTGARARPPLDADGLQALALHYLGRYATTRAKLRDYLRRKLAERGWAGEEPAPVEAVVARCAALGYVDDAAFAAARGAGLSRRGYGARRIADALRAAGVEGEDAAPARAAAESEALDAALRFARRRRIGPFAATLADRDDRRRALAAMLRAGHDLEIARRIVAAAPGSEIA